MPAIIFLVAWIYFMSDDEIAIPIEKIKEIQTVADETSHGKVQVDCRNIATVAHTKYGLDSISTNEIEGIISGVQELI